MLIFNKESYLMLLNFSFSNFTSFKNKVEFSMEPLTNNGSVENAIQTVAKNHHMLIGHLQYSEQMLQVKVIL